MIEILLSVSLVLSLECLAAYKLMKAWSLSASLMPAVLTTLYRAGWFYRLRPLPGVEPGDMLKHEWRQALENAIVDRTVPRWKAQLFLCPVCLYTHLPLLAGAPVAALMWWLLPHPWDWQLALGTWWLGWLCCPQFLFTHASKL
jgi:hypothetical protein